MNNWSSSESLISSHVYFGEDDNYYGIKIYDSDFDEEDSESEDDSTIECNSSSSSTGIPQDSPYSLGSMSEATLFSFEEGQFSGIDERSSYENISSQGPHDDDSDTVVLSESIDNISPLLTPSSSPPKDDSPVLLRRKDSTKGTQSKRDAVKKLSMQFLRGVSPFRQSCLGTSNHHGNHQKGCDESNANADVWQGPSHDDDSQTEESKMEDWEKYKAGGIFDMTEEDLRKSIMLLRKGKSLESLLQVGLSSSYENVESDGVESDGVEADGVEADGVEADRVEAYGVEEVEEENDDAVKRIYLSCLEYLTREAQTGVVRERKFSEQATDDVHIYGGDRANEDKSELNRLSTLSSMYEGKKEETRQRRLHRGRFAHELDNDRESDPDIPREEDYTYMQNVTMEANNPLDNVSVGSLPIEFIEE
ncbi:hypothetical protein C922_03967 [Plasmodium inui San Antonio 1]|uniref:Uncharacterized protein n=1 Tax=Plasmodium inui San Antonio 1 TaxID=1237626 RepID=W7A9A6_9APIC|nr:hypothetical protein C922_03967 [Plasmodium inui San Antonio 1]EUD65719.1 hypothetical protein C922_03967 [Plasmodium inui San Antonio 1]